MTSSSTASAAASDSEPAGSFFWADRLDYPTADPAASLQRFTVLRESHLTLLEGLSPEAGQRAGVHPERGEDAHLANRIPCLTRTDCIHSARGKSTPIRRHAHSERGPPDSPRRRIGVQPHNRLQTAPA